MAFNAASGTVTYRNDLSAMLVGRLTKLNGYIGSRIFPVVPVDSREDFYFSVNPGPMMVLPDNKRGDGGAYGRVDFSASQNTYRCKSYGLRADIPKKKVTEYTQLPLEEMASYVAMCQMYNAYEKRICDLAFDRVTRFPLGATTGHDAINEWDDHTNAEPTLDILTAKTAIVGNIGALGNDGNICAAMSWRSAHHLALCNEIRDKIGIKYKDNIPPAAIMEDGALAAAIGVDEVIVSNAQYKSSGTDAAPTGTNFVDDEYCLVFRRATVQGGKSNDTDIPSRAPVVCGLGVTFMWNANGSEMFPVYDWEEPGIDSLVKRVDQDTTDEVLLTGAGYLIGNLKT